MVERSAEELERVIEVRRRAGALREIRTSRGRTYLVVGGSAPARLLEVGAILSERDVEALSGPLARAAGLDVAYRMLSRRDRSEREIRGALAGAGIDDPEAIGDIVETLRRRGYLDDRRLAEGYIRFTMEHRPAGPHLLRRKLREVGVSEEIIEEEIGAAFARADERSVAAALAARRIAPNVGRERAVRRIQALLTRRGFSAGVVGEICAKVLRGEIPSDDA